MVTKGTTPTSVGLKFADKGIPFLRIQNISKNSVHLDDVLFIDKEAHQALKRSIVQPGDFLLTIAGTIGRIAIVPEDFPESNCNQAVAILRFDQSKLLPKYLLYWLQTEDAFGQISGKKVTATISNLSLGQIKSLHIPLPPLAEQKKIAAILDAADQLRQKDQQLIDHYTTLCQSLFLEMFGDPVSNPMGWEKIPLRESSLIFSDGPFGSNLKSEHYTEKGVRVLRLQNIGVNHLVDASKAYVSPEHYATISKHTCLPGDIVIATMGEPNIRSCIIPDYIDKAINKADCIQFRVDPTIGVAQYFNSMLNTPLFLSLVSHLLHGQTRTRISMGKLREIIVPVPPIKLQKKFAQNLLSIEQQKENAYASLEKSGSLFHSLLQKAFKGELTSSKVA